MTNRSMSLMNTLTPETRAILHKGGSVNFELKRALIPISLAIYFVLHFYFGVPLWVLMCLTVWIPLYYLGIPIYTRRRWASFEKEFAYRFPQQDYKGLLQLYKNQWFLRQFGPKAMMLGKLGLIYSAMGRYRDSERILEGSVRLAEHGIREKYMLNLAHVKYELGKYDEAERLYYPLLKRTPHLSGAATRIAMINVHKGRDLQGALELLSRELSVATGEDAKRISAAIESAKIQLA